MCGDDPRQMLEAAEIADDRRQRSRDDRLVERGEEHAEHERAEDPLRCAAGVRPPPLTGSPRLRGPIRSFLPARLPVATRAPLCCFACPVRPLRIRVGRLGGHPRVRMRGRRLGTTTRPPWRWARRRLRQRRRSSRAGRRSSTGRPPPPSASRCSSTARSLRRRSRQSAARRSRSRQRRRSHP